MSMRALVWSFLVAMGAAAPARAAAPVEEAQRAELDRLRAEIAGQVQLTAYDLVDELVLTWKNEPIFEKMEIDLGTEIVPRLSASSVNASKGTSSRRSSLTPPPSVGSAQRHSSRNRRCRSDSSRVVCVTTNALRLLL